MKVICTAVSRPGIGKKVDQDALMLKAAKIRKHTIVLAAICDGMGGMSKGELASSRLVRRFETWFYEEMPELFEKCEIARDIVALAEKSWRKVAAEANSDISGYGNLNGIRLGTTCIMLLVVDDNYLVMNIGDSRLYVKSREQFAQLTHDQSLFQKRLDNGLCDNTAEEFRKSGSILLQCIGILPEINPEIIKGSIDCDKISFLLCSDGFWKKQNSDAIGKFMIRSDRLLECTMHEQLKRQVTHIVSNGERDDISAVIIGLRRVDHE